MHRSPSVPRPIPPSPPAYPSPSHRAVVLAVLCTAAILALPAGSGAQHDHGTTHTAEPSGFGHIDFPTSAAPAAHAEFVRGVLLLHNFHYPQAVAALRRARALDPDDAMSAAFEALAYSHPVWNWQDSAAARSALRSLAPTREARARKARTPRERAWLDAIETLYEGDLPKAARDSAFSRAMARLHAENPADPEAATLYALSLLGLNQGDREPRAYAMAEAISDTVRRAHPRHPGALHYLIHSVDDPANAARGLDAARAYAQIAGSAGHALHMTSHIFIALGRWDDVEIANRRAHQAQAPELHSFGHGTHWLAYALMQQGRVREARGWLDSMRIYQRAVAAGTTPAVRGRADADVHAVLMTAAHVIDTDGWDLPLAHERFDTTYLREADVRTVADFVVGFAAARRAARPVDLTPGSRAADRVLADSMLARISARNAWSGSGRAGTSGASGASEVMEQVLRAERHVIDERPDSAVALLRAAAEKLEALPFAFGPPLVVKPPRERAAEILLATGRPAEALAQAELAESLAPGRTQARWIRARSLLALDRRADAAGEYRELASVWSGADSTFPRRQGARWGSTALAAGGDAAVRIDTVGYASGTLALRGMLYRPASAARRPALVLLHGCVGCWRPDDLDILGRLFASRGFVTFFPCRRGVGLSAGQDVAIHEQMRREGFAARDSAFGVRSTELLVGPQLGDVRAALAAIRLRDDVDPSRVAVAGISYGGILTLLAAEADPTVRAAVAFAPAAMNWGWNAPLRERLLTAARRTRVPVLVLQAENDWHVGPTHELPEAVLAGGGDSTGRIYPAVGANAGDGHAFMVLTPELWQDDVLAFLDLHLNADRRSGHPPGAGGGGAK